MSKAFAAFALNRRNQETYEIFTNMRRVLFATYEKSVDLRQR